mgnify:CR=1 FL=1
MLAIKANSLDCVGRVTNKEIGTAFKEWAIVCEALGKGQQSIIFRKGGIHEGKRGFQFKHDQFFLFPTRFHEQEQNVKLGSLNENLLLYLDAILLQDSYTIRRFVSANKTDRLIFKKAPKNFADLYEGVPDLSLIHI